MTSMLNVFHVHSRSLCLDVSIFPKDLLYKDILMELHVYDTPDYFDAIRHLLIFS
jgi:hypothetical protein